MLGEVNRLLDRYIHDAATELVMPTYTGPNGFLEHVITPLYKIVQAVRVPVTPSA